MEPRARLVLATFLVTLAVGVGTGWAVGRKTLPARPVTLPTPAEPLVEPPAPAVDEPPHLQALVLDLTSNEAATWREAAVRLAFTRPFPAKAVGAIDPPEHRVRVLKVLDAALAQCLPLDEVMQIAALGRLLAPSLATARHHLAIDLLGVSHDVGSLQSASEGGVAVGVALQALRSNDPRLVVKGLRALERMKPACARERVRSLLTTNTLVSTGMTQVRLGEAADQTLRALPSRTTPLAGLEELLRDTPLFETVREVHPAAAKADSVDAWFELARPVWRAWWTLSEAGTPPSDAIWRARTNEFLHFIETRRLHPRGRSVLHVRGPASVQCRATTPGAALTDGSLPFDIEGDVPEEVVRLACRHPENETLLDQRFPFEAGEELTIEVLPP
jgi:hypothetical protein